MLYDSDMPASVHYWPSAAAASDLSTWPQALPFPSLVDALDFVAAHPRDCSERYGWIVTAEGSYLSPGEIEGLLAEKRPSRFASVGGVPGGRRLAESPGQACCL